jgi:hypothetical protein
LFLLFILVELFDHHYLNFRFIKHKDSTHICFFLFLIWQDHTKYDMAQYTYIYTIKTQNNIDINLIQHFSIEISS